MKATDIYSLFEAQQELFEVEMSPSNLKKLASAIPGVKVGMEFEMVVPGAQGEDDDYEPEEDMDADESADDIEDIVRFYSHDDDYVGQVNSPGTLDRLRDELYEKFYEWQEEKIRNEWVDDDGKEFFAKWVKENVDPDEIAEEMETPEDLFGEKNPSKEDYEKFIEDQWEAEGSYYDQAYDSFREDRQNDGDYDESEFLSDIGIRYMSHVENNVNVDLDWPYYEEPQGSDGEDIDSVGDDFSDAIGKRVYSSTSYHGARRAPDAYSLEPDGSIDAGPGEAGLEFVSPPMDVDEMLEDLHNVKEWADRRGAYTNRSTGLHINVSIPNYNRDNLDFVKLAVLLGDKYVLEQFGRLSNSYAESALEIIKNRAKDNEDVDRLLNQLKNNVETIASKILHSGRTDKYTSINTKQDYVEFRSAGGDWLNRNFTKIEDTLLRFIVALDAACDPKKYKKEYVRGLYKILKPVDESADSSMFAKYMAGQITRSEYANSLEQKRKERFKKEGINILHPDDVEENDWEITYDDGKKSETIYLANTTSVPTDAAAFKAAQKFKPNWFKPDTIEYITVKPYKFDESLNDLKDYIADYGHKFQSVIAKDEEQAREFIRQMDPDYFSAYPNTEIELTQLDTSKRKIKNSLPYQERKLEHGKQWLERPKLWRATGRSSQAGRYYIAAVSREEAIDIAKRLDPDMAESDNFEIYVNDAHVDSDTYEAYVKAQEDLIQQREAERERDRQAQEFNQAGEEEFDISHLKTYRVSNMAGYGYFVAENGAEAAEIANKIDPEKFPRIENLTVQDQSHLTSTSNPALIRSMYKSQQEKLAALNSTPDQYSVYEASNDRGDRMFIAARTPVEAHTLAARLYPDVFNNEIRTERYGDATQMDAARLLQQQSAREQELNLSPQNNDWRSQLRGRLGNAQPAFTEPSSTRISDMQEYRVRNLETGESRVFAASSTMDAMRRAREQYPALFSNSGLEATISR